MMKISIVCPKCKRKSQYTLMTDDLRELYVLGTFGIAFYHYDHALYVCIDRFGHILGLTTCDPSSQMIYGVKMIVDDWIVYNNPQIRSEFELLIIDKESKLIDARALLRKIYALRFLRYMQRYPKIVENNPIVNAFGVRFCVRSNGRFLVASPASDTENGTKIEWLKLLATVLKSHIPSHTLLQLVEYINMNLTRIPTENDKERIIALLSS